VLRQAQHALSVVEGRKNAAPASRRCSCAWRPLYPTRGHSPAQRFSCVVPACSTRLSAQAACGGQALVLPTARPSGDGRQGSPDRARRLRESARLSARRACRLALLILKGNARPERHAAAIAIAARSGHRKSRSTSVIQVPGSPGFKYERHVKCPKSTPACSSARVALVTDEPRRCRRPTCRASAAPGARVLRGAPPADRRRQSCRDVLAA
jgi:hypothetical protein